MHPFRCAVYVREDARPVLSDAGIERLVMDMVLVPVGDPRVDWPTDGATNGVIEAAKCFGVSGRGKGVMVPGVEGTERLCFMCAWIKCPAHSAPINDSSPAMTEAAMIRASLCALAPGVVECAPAMPIIYSMDRCGGKTVPPPTVPTSMLGIDTVIKRSSSSLIASMSVMQLDDSTFCAGS